MLVYWLMLACCIDPKIYTCIYSCTHYDRVTLISFKEKFLLTRYNSEGRQPYDTNKETASLVSMLAFKFTLQSCQTGDKSCQLS